MIRRTALNIVKNRLAEFDSVVLLGPRQVGKSTLAREICDGLGNGACFLDLESPSDREKLGKPEEYFAAHVDQLIVLDEIQHVPDIFEALRVQIDARRRMAGDGGKFLLLGSASMDLLEQSSESLAGRISYVELTPLTVSEVMSGQIEALMGANATDVAAGPQPEILSNKEPDNGANIRATIDSLWLKGGFPESYLREDEETSLQWRDDFIRTYMERDVPNFGITVETDKLANFLRLLANRQGGMFDAANYGNDIGVKQDKIIAYRKILTDLLLVRELLPWSTKAGKELTKSPRLYIRDTGMLHALLNLSSMDQLLKHPVLGKSWECFVIESLIEAVGPRIQPYFYRTKKGGAEVDLVLDFPRSGLWAIEIKHSENPTVERAFYNAAHDLKAARRIVIHKGAEPFSMKGEIDAMPLWTAISEVRAASK